MHFFVTNPAYGAPSDAHDTLEEAAEYAIQACILGQLTGALVIGMEAPTYRQDVPAYIAFFISAGPNLEDLP
jgi:hypothetical protein